MGIETAAALAMAGSSIYGAHSQDKANKRAVGAANQRSNYLNTMGSGLMGAGDTSGFQKQLQDLLGGLDFKPAEAPGLNFQGPNLNAGNDSLMQILRMDPTKQMDPTASDFLHKTVSSGGNPFDTSDLFAKLGVVDNRNINDQVSQLIASSSGGGLGERFGSSAMARQAGLREKSLQDIGARNAGLAFQSHEAAQGRALSASDQLNQALAQMFGLQVNAANSLNQGELAASGQRLQAGEADQNAWLQTLGLNNAQGNAVFGQKLQAILQAAGLSNSDRQYNSDIFRTIAGLPGQATTGPSAMPGAITDIGQLALLWPLLMQGQSKSNAAPPVAHGSYNRTPDL